MSAFNPIEYPVETPGEVQSRLLRMKRERGVKQGRNREKSNGSTAAPIKGRKVSGGARTRGGSM